MRIHDSSPSSDRFAWYNLIFFIFVLFPLSGAYAASVGGASPPAVNVAKAVDPQEQLKQDYAVMPIPFQIVLEVVSDAEKAGLLVQRKGEPLKIGFGRDLPQWYRGDLAPELVWDDLPEGGRVAAFSITSPEAKAIRVGLRLDRLPEGVEVRFFSLQNGQSYGPFTVKSTRLHLVGDEAHEPDAAAESLFWSPVIEGDTAGVEIYAPATVVEPFAIEAPQVQHLGYSVQDPDDKALQDIGRSGACNIDVKCRTTTPSNLSNAVAKIIFTNGGSSFLCTGTLLNDEDDSSWIPYFMTANHCLATQSSASTLNSYWFFERATCGGANPTSVTQMVGGADLLATGTNTDFTFLRLRDAQISSLPNIWFAGWTSTNPTG